eukprot:6205896-Pleurochrysis_carterae.AAC.1
MPASGGAQGLAVCKRALATPPTACNNANTQVTSMGITNASSRLQRHPLLRWLRQTAAVGTCIVHAYTVLELDHLLLEAYRACGEVGLGKAVDTRAIDARSVIKHKASAMHIQHKIPGMDACRPMQALSRQASDG